MPTIQQWKNQPVATFLQITLCCFLHVLQESVKYPVSGAKSVFEFI